jgi:hypothetical protein
MGGDLETRPVSLPYYVANPDQRDFVIRDTIAASEQALTDARKALAKATNATTVEEHELKVAAAETKHEAVLAVLKAEQFEKDSDQWKIAAREAFDAQRKQKLAEAKLALHQAKAEVAKKAEEKEKKKVTEAEKALADAEKKMKEEISTGYKRRSEDNYPATSTGRRLAFARWVADTNNPLTARVAMNHIWLRHFGRGIVSTASDFGRSGAKPSHPELLDWIAAEFMAQGWSMKKMHRLLLTSSTYRMASTPDDRNAAVDPDNVFLWRMPSRRIEAELIRDNLLYVSGNLDNTMGGPDVDHTKGLTSRRRSVYLRIAAEKEVDFLTVFDGPTATECYERRPTVLPQQALALANSELGFAQAKVLAKALADHSNEDFVVAAFRRILGRVPTSEEQRLCLEFLAGHSEHLEASLAPVAANSNRTRENLLLTLFNHTDFVTIR